MLRLVADPGPRRVVIAGVALAAVFVTHAISAVILAVLLAIILLTFLGIEGWQARTVRCLAGAFILACGLAAFWLVPAFAHNNLRGPYQLGQSAGRAPGRLAGRQAAVPRPARMAATGRLAVCGAPVPAAPAVGAGAGGDALCVSVGCRPVPALGSGQRRQHAARQPRARLCWCPGCPAVRRSLGPCHDPAGGAARWRVARRRPPSSRQRCWWWQSVAPAEARWSASRPRPRCCVPWPGSSRRTFPTAPASSPSVTSPMSAGSPACRIRTSGCRGRRGGTP